MSSSKESRDTSKRFLNRLQKEKKLQIVEPSQEIKDAYTMRSSETLRSAKVLFGIDNLRDAVAMAYYSMYYMLLALLFRIGIKCENHTAAILLLGKVFGKDTTAISKAKKERVDKQYYVDFSITKDEVIETIKTAEIFDAEIFDLIDTLNSEAIGRYRKTAQKLFTKSK